MKKFTIIFFAVFALALAGYFITTTFFTKEETEVVRSKVVIPAKRTETEENAAIESYASTEGELTTFISLNIDETLISTLGFDINNDSYEDQVIGVKKANNPNIVIIVGIYNPEKEVYQRFTEIQTPISQVKTFSLTTMDLIGNHTNALVYTGFAQDNDSILQVYLPRFKKKEFELLKIIDLKTDGSVMIQQTPRDDNYSIYNSDAESYPIWMYSTEEKENGNGFDQIQTKYEWDKKTKQYEITSTNRVSSKRIEAKELARILDGKVETFHNFLDGLWYKTSNTGETRYLFFDPKSEEIIFFYQSIQEVYDWLNSTLRRSGIYISASNKSISNLVRYFDIALVSVDEIRIRVRDDVRMVIGADTLWDGIYKKTSRKFSTLTKTEKAPESEILKTLETGDGKWTFSDNTVVFADGSFTMSDKNNVKETGVYTYTKLFDVDLIQFRADNKKCKLNNFFMYSEKEDRIDLIPVKVTTDSCVIEGNIPTIRLEKFKSE